MLNIVYYGLLFLYEEILYKLVLQLPLNISVVFFSLTIGLFVGFLSQFIPKRINYFIFNVINLLLCIYYGTALIVRKVFGIVIVPSTFTMYKQVTSGAFKTLFFDVITSNILIIILILLPFIVGLFLNRYLSNKPKFTYILVVVIPFILFLLCSDSLDTFYSNKSDVDKLGVCSSIFMNGDLGLISGLESGHEPDGHEPDGHESDGHESDEHIWLSLRNAKKCVEAIKDVLCELDPTNMDRYKKNAEEYIEKLELLDQKYMEVVSNSKNNTLIFGDRFPFRYLVDDYNLNYYAAFAGCSSESEASFNTITFLAKKLDELKLSNILTIEGNNHKIAETIIKNTENKDQKVLILNSMQGRILEGDTYLSIMEANLEVLKKALN